MARSNKKDLQRRDVLTILHDGGALTTPRLLHHFIREVFDLEISRTPLVAGSSAPFDYLVHTFFEGTVSPAEPGLESRRAPQAPRPADCVVWAARGAGKTMLGAVATILDMMFKPGIEIRILGGSLEQSQRMHEHLRRLFERPGLCDLLAHRITERRVVLRNGSRARILAQSQTSVRGTRVQKVRCDEVELFNPEVWNAVQLTTRSMDCAGAWGKTVRGAVEALSTMHRPYGLMWNLVGAAPGDAGEAPAPARPRVVLRWGLIDVLGKCGPAHKCNSCPLQPECNGRAKNRDRRKDPSRGHVPVADAASMKTRVSLQVWESEMLCLRPRRSDCVFPEFDPASHVGEWRLSPDAPPDDPGASARPGFDPPPARGADRRRWVAGMDFGIRAPTVVLLAWYRENDPDRVLHVEAEHAAADMTLDQHARALFEGTLAGWPTPAPAIEWIGVDPAGHQRSNQTGISSVAVLRKAGFAVRSRRLALHEGLEFLRRRLRPAADGTAGRSPTRLLIHRRCSHLIESLSRYHYPEDRPDSLEPVKDGADHAVDALRYLVASLDMPHGARLSTY